MSTDGRVHFNNPIDLQNNTIFNACLQALSTNPAGVAGLILNNTAVDSPVMYSAVRAAWITLDATKLVNAIPYTALVNLPVSVIMGNTAASAGAPMALTPTQAKTILAITPADVSGFDTQVRSSRLDQLASPTSALLMNAQLISNLAAGVAGTDAVNLLQLQTALQNAAAGIAGKAPVVAIATANVTSLSGLSNVLDGVTCGTAGMRVLLPAQTTASQNGPWIVQSGAWTRPTTEGTAAELETGAMWLVEQGTVNKGSIWWINSPAAGVVITPGTTAIGIVQFLSASTVTALANGGLQLVGGAFSVLLPANSGLVTDVTGLHIDTALVTRKYSNATVGDGSSNAITITHNLGTKMVGMFLINNSTGDREDVSWNATTTNTIVLTFGGTAPTTGKYSVVVFG